MCREAGGADCGYQSVMRVHIRGSIRGRTSGAGTAGSVVSGDDPAALVRELGIGGQGAIGFAVIVALDDATAGTGKRFQFKGHGPRDYFRRRNISSARDW